METVSGGNPLEALRWQQEKTKVVENDNGTLGQEDFFALLTQQLANQDPTKPADNAQMISQMTAFSTTEGVAELNDQFTQFANSMSSSQALQASSLVGRSVLVNDNIFGKAEGQQPSGKIATDEPASNVVVYVENTVGEIVQTIPVGDVKAGETGFTWNGMNSAGDEALEGAYRFRISGLIDGQSQELQAMTYRKVDSVTLAGAGGNILLNLNGGTSMAFADIIEVSDG